MPVANRTTVTVTLACLEHRPRPDLFGIYSEIPLKDFIGTSVLLGFKGKDAKGIERTEHMWVSVTGLADERAHGDELVGVIDNNPFLQMEYDYGDTISFRRDEIEEDRVHDCCEHRHAQGVEASVQEVKN